MNNLDFLSNNNKLDTIVSLQNNPAINVNTDKSINDKENNKENNKFVNSTITFIYNKKWLICIGLCILLCIIYIYKYDISINIPCPITTFKKPKTDNTCDDITEFNDDNNWILEEEIKKYMELQDNYIKSNSTN